MSSTQNARDHFWAQRAVELERAAAAMDEDLSAMDSYTRQLLIDSTFIRFCNMNGIQEQGFVLVENSRQSDGA
ncbi:MAG: hypothetical protein E7028_09260 [Planctomycetaceae bacterium]|nr:hypothetical protein [Planctomycetaceae bacterium]